MSIAASLKSISSTLRNKVLSTQTGQKLFGGSLKSGVFGDSLYQRLTPTTLSTPLSSQLRNMQGVGLMAGGYGVYKATQAIGNELDLANERAGRGSAYGGIVRGAGMLTGGAMGLVGTTRMLGQQARILGNTFDKEKYDTLTALNKQELRRLNRLGFSSAEKNAILKGESSSPLSETFRELHQINIGAKSLHYKRMPQEAAKIAAAETVRKPEYALTVAPESMPALTSSSELATVSEGAVVPVSGRGGSAVTVSRGSARTSGAGRAGRAGRSSGAGRAAETKQKRPSDYLMSRVKGQERGRRRTEGGRKGSASKSAEKARTSAPIPPEVLRRLRKLENMAKGVSSPDENIRGEAKVAEEMARKLRDKYGIKGPAASAAPKPPPRPSPRTGPAPAARPGAPKPGSSMPSESMAPGSQNNFVPVPVDSVPRTASPRITPPPSPTAATTATAPPKYGPNPMFVRTEKAMSKFDVAGDFIQGIPGKLLEMAVPAVGDAAAGIAAAPVAPFMLLKGGFANSNYVGSAIFGMGMYAGATAGVIGGNMSDRGSRNRSALGGTAVYDPNAGGRARRSGMDPNMSNTDGLVQSLHRLR